MVESHRVIVGRIHSSGESLAFLGLCDNFRKVSIFPNMLDAIKSYFIHGIDTVLVDAAGFDNAVGRHNHGSREAGEFKFSSQ